MNQILLIGQKSEVYNRVQKEMVCLDHEVTSLYSELFQAKFKFYSQTA